MEFIVSGFILLVTAFIPASEAHETPGIYCNGMPQTWKEAKEGCTRSCTGSLVSYDTGIGKTVAELSLRSDADVWTAEYAKGRTRKGQYENGSYQKLCGFVYLNNSLLHVVNKEVLYGSCNVERNYVCFGAENRLVVNQSNWQSIESDCKEHTYNLQSVKPGFYWTKYSKDFIVVTEKEPTLPTSESVLCGAYTSNIGQYFTNCETKRASLCQCSDNRVDSLHKSCFIRQTTLTNRSLTTSAIRTTKIVSTMIKQTEKAMETIVRTDTHSITSTENNLQSTRNQLMAESTTSLNESKVQENEFEKQRKEENLSDLSVEVGLPVGVCMALIFGIILSIYLARRYKCLKRKTDCNQNNSREAQHPRSSKYSFGTAHAHFNASYEASEEIAIKKISNDDKKNVSENSNRNKQHHSDSNSEYAVVHKTIGGKTFNSDKNKQNLYCYSYGYKDNCASSNEVQTAEYSFAKETCTDEVYDVERCHTESDDYDVTGNILSCTSNISSNIYNQLQSNEYDSTASVSGNDCNHMYDITQNQRTESVYDSTNEVHNSTQCDNVYNQLSQATATSNQNN